MKSNHDVNSEGAMVKRSTNHVSRILFSACAVLSLTALLTCGLLATQTPTVAGATNVSLTEKLLAAADQMINNKGYDPYSYAEGAVSLASDEVSSLPEKYDLRDPNGDGDRSDSVVTSVKLQNPWGTCWAFAAMVACETSILSDAGKTAAETGLDLSELQLAAAVFRSDGAPASAVGEAQAGEGIHNNTSDPNAGLDAGGVSGYFSSVFGAGIGPVLESSAPYKNAEGIKLCTATSPSGEVQTMVLTDEKIKQKEAEGYKIVPDYWAGNTKITNPDGSQGTLIPTWTISDDLWNKSILKLENSNNLPNTRKLDSDGKYLGTDMQAVSAIKSELTSGRGVLIFFCADTSLPDEETTDPRYINEKWAHYTYEPKSGNHVVTIVGYDDTYSRTNFGDGVNNLPEGDGAWIVKNSWGASTNEFPNKGDGDWGIEENGEHTGYFYLSYYDQSITEPQTFDFDENSYENNSETHVDQYDYMAKDTNLRTSEDTKISEANIYTASEDFALSSLACDVALPNTTVTYDVYLLDDQAEIPDDESHSTKVLTTEATFTYGGYHRVTLDATSQVAIRKGQRYAVVTTQKCNDDGKYYLAIPYCESTIEIHSEFTTDKTLTVEAKINEGESMVGLSNGNWEDMTDVAAEIKEKNPTFVCDNLSIKSYGVPGDFATKDSLTSLKLKVAEAKAALDTTEISADGSDIVSTEQWMTQAEYDALNVAISNAEELLSLAGEDYNAATSPTQEKVDAALAALTWETHAGTKDGDDDSDDDSDHDAIPNDEGRNNPAGKDAKTETEGTKSPVQASLAKTGDDTTTLMTAAIAMTIASTIMLAGSIAARGGRKE
ncbi:MAG: lectin like domain-containing protein [Phoenicibacter congonensis]|uniref:Lectin like domain-containing protein n=1 Tax=Phoenicibacter congonensis TaxID=1944646 RepID=A0AA43UBB7_9ACTN|nr:lectin like domain-containing protein [Phoenicibacter congonensis]